MPGNIQPEQIADQQWQQWLEKAAEQEIGISFDEAFIASLQQVWQGSDYVVQSCLRNPALLVDLHASGDLGQSLQPGAIAQRLKQELASVSDETDLHRRLRQFRRYHMLRIIWRDLLRTAPLAETLEDLSALADACIDEALALLYAWAIDKQGIPRDAQGEQQRLVVLGMGKLGARELNLSSDIDLIFTYPAKGQVEGPRAVSNEQFFIRLCQQLIKALNTQTVDGFVFRVDARLRPFGDAGPMAMNFDAMEAYYESHAREWERYAMIKARVVAGDQQAGGQLMAMLRPFVYRRYLDFGAFESLRKMKKLISQELHRKGMDRNVKLGPGGIREIEFIGQAFQLIRGGRDPDLQVRGIQPVLRHLGEKDLLPEYVVQELARAYEFLRLVENRIQAWQDRQTHLLPEDELGRLRLARSMGFETWERFFATLEKHRGKVQGHFDQVFAAPQAEDEGEDQPLAALWQQHLDAESAIAVLDRAGFRHSQAVLEQLSQFHGSHMCRGMGVKGRERLDQLMPLLLDAVGGCEDPEATLSRVLKLIETIGKRTAYLALLVENPIALSQLIRLAGISPWITQQLERQPLLMDELLDPRRLFTPSRENELREELASLLSGIDPEDLEQQMERLRQFSQSNILRVAAADLTGAIPLMVVSDYLTDIAEVVIERVMGIVWWHMTQRHGKPSNIIGEETGFAVLGYGKLGGIELGYGSDLDLVFLHGSQSHSAMTDGARQIANDVFYARMGQRMIHMFTTRTPSGLLYEIDMRLRPNGNSGMLVTSLEAFERYQKNDAWTWEHQALLRARAVVGDPVVIARFEVIRREVLGQPRDPEKLRNEVRDMREKMRESLDKSKPGQFDIKQGRGGIADIEFMVQYCVLRWANQYPDLLEWTDNIRFLETLEKHRLLEGHAAGSLADCYRSLRAAYHRNALSELPGLIDDSQLLAERAMVQEIWQALIVA